MGERERIEELEALLALNALEGEERSGVERELGAAPAHRAQIAAALADAVAEAPPQGLRSGVLGAALERRGAGRPPHAATPCSSLEAYRRTADDLYEALGGLTDDAWDAQAHPEIGPVRSVLAHLVGVEELMLGWLGARPAPDPEAVVDHVEATRATFEELTSADPRATAERWHSLTREVEEACAAAEPGLQVLAHDLPTDVDGLVLLRTFEIWAHTIDVCTATGRAMPEPDAPRLALMSGRLMTALPAALALRDKIQPGRTARMVLTGDAGAATAGGSYDVSLDPESAAGEPDLVIVADVVDICTVAARRLPATELDTAVEGDPELADAVLSAVDAFARD